MVWANRQRDIACIATTSSGLVGSSGGWGVQVLAAGMVQYGRGAQASGEVDLVWPSYPMCVRVSYLEGIVPCYVRSAPPRSPHTRLVPPNDPHEPHMLHAHSHALSLSLSRSFSCLRLSYRKRTHANAHTLAQRGRAQHIAEPPGKPRSPRTLTRPHARTHTIHRAANHRRHMPTAARH